jgi:transcriptional regulator with XRE-family HTH domain
MADVIDNIGSKIKQIRIKKGLTQECLSTRTGITKSYISLLEAGKKIPAISTLSEIATALGVRIVELLDSEEDYSDVSVMRKSDWFKKSKKNNQFGYIYEALLLGKKDREMVPFIVKIIPDENREEPRSDFEHTGEEFDLVLEGRVKYTIDNIEYILEVGDSIYFSSTKKHRVKALDGVSAVTLSVHSSH